ncbi:Uncharacterised protein [uncultured archaeon]|nr:Uncharacterised protein [uncultured archaeon]
MGFIENFREFITSSSKKKSSLEVNVAFDNPEFKVFETLVNGKRVAVDILQAKRTFTGAAGNVGFTEKSLGLGGKSSRTTEWESKRAYEHPEYTRLMSQDPTLNTQRIAQLSRSTGTQHLVSSQTLPFGEIIEERLSTDNAIKMTSSVSGAIIVTGLSGIPLVVPQNANNSKKHTSFNNL